MSFLEELGKRREAEFFSHVRDEIKSMFDRNMRLNYEQYERMRMNSYEAVLVLQLLDDPALLRVVRHFVDNCGQEKLSRFDTGTTYDEVLLGRLIYILCDRFDALIQAKVSQ